MPLLTHNTQQGNAVSRRAAALMALAAQFTAATRVADSDLDLRSGTWCLTFSNGCTLRVSANGTARLDCPTSVGPDGN